MVISELFSVSLPLPLPLARWGELGGGIDPWKWRVGSRSTTRTGSAFVTVASAALAMRIAKNFMMSKSLCTQKVVKIIARM